MYKVDPQCHQTKTDSPSARTSSKVKPSLSAGTYFCRYIVYTDN